VPREIPPVPARNRRKQRDLIYASEKEMLCPTKI
jgi:hypothetical protein